ncbi:Protein phosphatase 2C 4 [Spathaspora sp. JA1]|nr:Protein phosphatase 2C 4 [Spathaspora sp. JA1]
MGQLLSHPIEDKQLDYRIHRMLSYCIGAMQGYRMTMEDAHQVKISEDEAIAIFAVFDGHGGRQCAEYISNHLPKFIFRQLITPKNKLVNHFGIEKILKNSFFKIDNDLSRMNLINCGSTAIITLIINSCIYVANTGDSRCILSLDGGYAKTLSFDHKPSNMGERVRIENANGYILNSRINEVLALSRAFGDFKFKMPYINSSRNKYILENNQRLKRDLVHLPPELFQVTVEPDILMYDMNYNTIPEFIVIACDGVWDCFKNGQLVKLIRDKLAFGWKLNKIVEFVLNDCLNMANNYTGIGFDNMTMIIVALHPKQGGVLSGNNLDDWYRMMMDKILKEKGLS